MNVPRAFLNICFDLFKRCPFVVYCCPFVVYCCPLLPISVFAARQHCGLRRRPRQFSGLFSCKPVSTHVDHPHPSQQGRRRVHESVGGARRAQRQSALLHRCVAAVGPPLHRSCDGRRICAVHESTDAGIDANETTVVGQGRRHTMGKDHGSSTRSHQKRIHDGPR